MKSDFRDELPEKVIREGDNSYFLYNDSFDGTTKITVYHKYTKVIQVSVDTVSRNVRCLSTQSVTHNDLKHVEQLLKGVIPQEVLLLELFQKALKSKDGLIELNY